MSPQLKAILAENSFIDATEIQGVVVAKMDYLTTRGICVGLDETSTRLRYCYQDRAEANRAFIEWVAKGDPDQHPPGNWIKMKGKYQGQWVDDLNPNWSKN